MHAFYRRLLHLRHAHDKDAVKRPVPAQPSPAPRETGTQTRPTAASTPRPPTRPRTAIERDRQPSLYTLLVPGLIESGYTLEQISDVTGMPQALIELIADGHSPGVAAHIDAPPKMRAFVETAGQVAVRARRSRTRTTVGIVLAAIVNIAASIASVIWHIPALGAAATVASCLLLVAVFVLARRPTNRTGASPKPQR